MAIGVAVKRDGCEESGFETNAGFGRSQRSAVSLAGHRNAMEMQRSRSDEGWKLFRVAAEVQFRSSVAVHDPCLAAPLARTRPSDADTLDSC